MSDPLRVQLSVPLQGLIDRDDVAGGVELDRDREALAACAAASAKEQLSPARPTSRPSDGLRSWTTRI
ncbi:MAG TPA: hypothetical protein VHJ39_07240 [Solirubrobacteraceae bacterium]|jgi:hypothetical protein|nr:hypothetical protein [Solirubrobacteraceae bacterium]